MIDFLFLLLSIFIIQFGAWLYYLFKHNPTIVDVTWPLVIMVTGLWSFDTTPSILLVILCLWALRLSIFLYVTRVMKKVIDKRYQDLASYQSNKKLYYFRIFQIQGLLGIGVGSVFLISYGNGYINTLLVTTGALISLGGFIVECIADYQLYVFKKQNQGICQNGLWSYSRHPNYVGEILVWLGFSIALFPQNYLSFLSPLLLWIIMHFITLPLTEKLSEEKHGELFRQYKNNTKKWL